MTKLLAILSLLAFLITNTAYSKTVTLTADNHVLLRNEVTDNTMAKLVMQLNEQVTKRGSKSYPIYLVLDSPGGSIDAGLSFLEYAKTVPNLETITIFSASMAAFITQSLPGNRNILESGILMFHRAKGGVDGQFESGELESRLDLYKRLVRNMEDTSAKRMCLSLEAYKASVKDELWILGFESVSKKAADEVVSIICTKDLLLSTNTETYTVMGMFQIRVSFNGCPLLRTGTVAKEDSKYSSLYSAYIKEKYSVVRTK